MDLLLGSLPCFAPVAGFKRESITLTVHGGIEPPRVIPLVRFHCGFALSVITCFAVINPRSARANRFPIGPAKVSASRWLPCIAGFRMPRPFTLLECGQIYCFLLFLRSFASLQNARRDPYSPFAAPESSSYE